MGTTRQPELLNNIPQLPSLPRAGRGGFPSPLPTNKLITQWVTSGISTMSRVSSILLSESRASVSPPWDVNSRGCNTNWGYLYLYSAGCHKSPGWGYLAQMKTHWTLSYTSPVREGTSTDGGSGTCVNLLRLDEDGWPNEQTIGIGTLNTAQVMDRIPASWNIMAQVVHHDDKDPRYSTSWRNTCVKKSYWVSSWLMKQVKLSS